MTVSFTLRQTTSIVTGPLYRVKNEVTAADGADTGAFVYKTSTQAYSHIATAADYETYPNSYDTAFADGDLFYRYPSVQRDWETITEAEADIEVTQSRLKLLANDLTTLQGDFIHDETVVIEGE
jgi:hypothetical protein